MAASDGLQVRNVVASVDLNCPVDLHKVAAGVPDTKYEPERYFASLSIPARNQDRSGSASRTTHMTAPVMAPNRITVTSESSSTPSPARRVYENEVRHCCNSKAAECNDGKGFARDSGLLLRTRGAGANRRTIGCGDGLVDWDHEAIIPTESRGWIVGGTRIFGITSLAAARLRDFFVEAGFNAEIASSL